MCHSCMVQPKAAKVSENDTEAGKKEKAHMHSQVDNSFPRRHSELFDLQAASRVALRTYSVGRIFYILTVVCLFY